MKQVLKLKSILSRIDFKIDFKGLKSILKSILRIDETPPRSSLDEVKQLGELSDINCPLNNRCNQIFTFLHW